MRRHYSWNDKSEKLDSTFVPDGTLLPECKENMHYFRHAHCQCWKYNLTNVRLAIAQKEANAQTK